jgi:hypothetical protein
MPLLLLLLLLLLCVLQTPLWDVALAQQRLL